MNSKNDTYCHICEKAGEHATEDHRPTSISQALRETVEFLNVADLAFKKLAAMRGEVYEPGHGVQDDLLKLASFFAENRDIDTDYWEQATDA